MLAATESAPGLCPARLAALAAPQDPGNRTAELANGEFGAGKALPPTETFSPIGCQHGPAANWPECRDIIA